MASSHKTIRLAASVARAAHAGQLYGDQDYCWFHVAGVVKNVTTLSSPDDADWVALVSTAWLHDVVEDTDTTLKELTDLGFSSEIVKAVDAMTKRQGESYADYMRRVLDNPVSRKVKRADVAFNLEQSVLAGRTKGISKYSKAALLLAT